MTPEEFLIQRYDQICNTALGAIALAVEDRAVIAGLASQLKAVVEWHKNWPVLVEEGPKFDMMPDGFDTVQYKMSKRMAWLTQEEYVKVFGRQPPTATLIRRFLETFKTHPDFDPDWLT